ncbi:MAG: uroporphyrinogen-III C-methyltransferase [Candidatus Nanopelagicales bacterium]
MDLSGRQVLVVGGGPVAARRVTAALAAGGEVTVIAPAICEDLAESIAAGNVGWVPRDFAAADLTAGDWWLVHTATGETSTDGLVAALADVARIWCVRADRAELSAAWVPAVTRDATGLTVAVSADADPGRAAAVRDAIAARLASGEFGVRRSASRGGQQNELRGRVALVGGGPGDPGLLTVRARRLIAAADVIVADRLAPQAVLRELSGSVARGEVTIIDVGKAPGNHPVTQSEINRLLVEHARRGALVVRLKGGDPFVLGRGGEEAAYCVKHGVAVEIVPGVSSALAVPAAVGIPVTHRGVATEFRVISGHAPAPGESPREPTLIFLMGVATLRQTAAELIAHGRPARTPVAVIEDGTLPTQRTTVGTLANIADQAEKVGVRNPAVIVVGEVVAIAGERRTDPADPAGGVPE